jgi:predicted PurR-regulated permease PerM
VTDRLASARDQAQRGADARAHYAPAEPRALGTLAILAAAAILWMVAPLGAGVSMGTLLAFATYRPYRRLAKRTRRPMLSAALVATAATVLVAGAVGTLTTLLVLQGVSIVSTLPHAFAPGGSAASALSRLANTGPLATLKLQPATLSDKLRGELVTLTTSLAAWAAQTLGLVFDGLLALFFMALTMGFVLLHWSEIARHAERMLPFNPHHTRRLMRELRRVGRSVIIGNFGTGLVQGAIAAVGYRIAGVPEPAFWGAITAVASLIPTLGTMLIWVPAGVILLLRGHTSGGTFVLVWGSIAVVLVCDYFVRPRLVGRSEAMPTWLTFVSLFGGIKLFGVMGLLLGPLLAGMSIASLKLYERARRFRLGTNA